MYIFSAIHFLLSTAIAVCHTAIFDFQFGDFLKNSLETLSFIYGLFPTVLPIFQAFGCSPDFIPVTDVQFDSIVAEEHIIRDLNFLKLVGDDFRVWNLMYLCEYFVSI